MSNRGCRKVTPVCLLVFYEFYLSYSVTGSLVQPDKTGIIFCADIHADRRDRIRVFLEAEAEGRMDSDHRPEGVEEAAENRMDRMVLPGVPTGQAVCRETYYERT